MSERAIPFDELELLPTDRAERMDSIFESLDKKPQASDQLEMASDLWSLARMRDQFRG
jgi:hypothetical protein